MDEKKESIYRITENLFISNKNDKEIKFFVRFLKDNFIYTDFIKSFFSENTKQQMYGRDCLLYNFIHNILIMPHYIDNIKLYRELDYKLNKILEYFGYNFYPDLDMCLEEGSQQLSIKEILKYKIYLE